VTNRRLLLLLLSPLWLVLAAAGLVVGLTFFAGSNPTGAIVAATYSGAVEGEQLAYLLVRATLFLFQLLFIVIVFGVALRIFRRRGQIGRWLMGDPLVKRLSAGERGGTGGPAVLQSDRRRTLHQIISSLIAVIVIVAAIVLSLGQFIARADLAVVVAALTSSLAWGARLPIGDFLGGVSNIFESNLIVGDHIEYRQFDQSVEGVVEVVDIRFVSVRALSGELTTIPFGELRVFTNYSRGGYGGVYAAFPIATADLDRAVAVLSELSAQSPALLPDLIEPWQPMSLDGEMGKLVNLVVFGQTRHGREPKLQLALRELVQTRLADAGIRVGGPEDAA
jgi:small-conductance mechanosensitive channel